MEIKNYTSAVNAYRFAAENQASASRTQKKNAGVRTNTDKAEFSAASRQSFSDTLKAAASKAADSSASPEKIAAISMQVRNGTYNVSAEEVASAIIGF